MKTVVFDKKSWHYWLATEYGNFYPYGSRKDRCHYIRRVLVGFLKVLTLLSLAALAGSTFGAFLYTGYQILTTGDGNVTHYPLFQQISYILWSSVFLSAIALVVIAGICSVVEYTWNSFEKSRLYKVISKLSPTINVNRGSWHYKLAKDVGNLPYGGVTLFSYIWALFKAFLVILICTFVVLLVGGTFLSPYVWAVWMAIDGFTFHTPASIVVASIILQVLGLAIFALIYTIERIKKRKRAVQPVVEPKGDSFFGEAYKTFKDKYCAFVEFR